MCNIWENLKMPTNSSLVCYMHSVVLAVYVYEVCVRDERKSDLCFKKVSQQWWSWTF